MKTDSQLRQDIRTELKWEPSVFAARIDVDVASGVATLTGEVDSYLQRWNAERAAHRVTGLRAVATKLKVALTHVGHHSDADIAESVENVLEWTLSVPAGTLHVMVEGGWVTLSGDVDLPYEREAASQSVGTLLGVTGVSNFIRIRPSLTSVAVKSGIELALAGAAIADASQISVSVHGSDVTLAGTVESASERAMAKQAAWSTPGVRNVVDMMTLVC
jgi:osmotically-inducible protein OsmY